MLIVAEFKSFSTYNFLMRSDLDGFLTPGNLTKLNLIKPSLTYPNLD
jgi:hypothetical protein